MGGFNAPWLTSDPEAGSQGWAGGGFKTAVRITVQIPDGDDNLYHWPEMAALLKMDPTWYQALHQAGGGGSDDWYVYTGVIPPAWFLDVRA